MSIEAVSNPFATRFTLPGRIEWVETPDARLEEVADRIVRHQFRGAIVGPHGSGKSTLLEHLAPLLGTVILRRDAQGKAVPLVRGVVERGRELVWLQLRKTEPESLRIPWSVLNSSTLLILDGFEQLTAARRLYATVRTRLIGSGLLVTSHRRTLLPTICYRHITAETAQRIVERLVETREDLSERIRGVATQVDFEQQLRENGGNMREVLMGLYDQVERERALS
jgi:energy-coupling factor transporter ATP-binding protein EcfA2